MLNIYTLIYIIFSYYSIGEYNLIHVLNKHS
jgi:hypothetical protein